MFFALTGCLLLSGLCCLWIALSNLCKLDQLQPEPIEAPQESESEESQRTRLGRMIEEVKLSV